MENLTRTASVAWYEFLSACHGICFTAGRRPDASARLEGHIITRVIIRLVVGAVLGTIMDAIFGLVLYLIFGWLLAGVTTFLGLNILQTPPGLYIGAIVGSLFGAIAALIFVGAVNIAEASPFFSFFGAVFGGSPMDALAHLLAQRKP